MSVLLKHISVLLGVVLLSGFIRAQETATLSGTIKDEQGTPLKGVLVVTNKAPKGSPKSVLTNSNGAYTLVITANVKVIIQFVGEGYKTEAREISAQPGTIYRMSPTMEKLHVDIKVHEVVAERNRGKSIDKIDHKVFSKLPNPSMNFEALLKAVGIGVSGNNELSSQYSVRGGNFDENLIYVNGIEVYRPFLVRSGQQEGLSFVNSDMVSSVAFSAGGWEAKYGDKLSSVLSIEYKEPDSFAGSFSGSMQGGTFHLEGASDNKRFTHITGVRFKSNQYILGSLDTDGDYRPLFMDAQTYLTWDASEKWEIGFLGNYGRNRYKFIPQTRTTDFGTINQALRLSVFFDGSEIDQYQTYFGALTNTYKPRPGIELHFNASAYKSFEDETFDVIGAYRIDELERDLGDDNFGDVAFSRGVGQFHDHARNYLEALVANVQHTGTITTDKHITNWGIKLQHEGIHDVLSEWGLVDSAGYSIPHVSDSVGYKNAAAQPQQELNLNELIKSNNDIQSTRLMGYVQREWSLQLKDTSEMGFVLGIRENYWDYNKELVLSPRANMYYKPNWKNDFLFRISGGYYYQPPFYRELRGFDGTLNPNLRAQQSIHAVLGMDYNFLGWGRPFKLVTEMYYKDINRAIPYYMDNVRIRYFAKNNAKAFATGIDAKLNGELVKGIDSWVNLSVMTTRENLSDDNYTEYINTDGDTIIRGYTHNTTVADSFEVVPGYIPRPTDQRVNFSMVFQDYLPKLPSLKMQLTLFFGTGLPFGPPMALKFRNAFRMPPYRRVDLGFSYHLKSPDKKVKPKSPLRHFTNVWLSIQVFNLLQIDNTISYQWVKDVTSRTYAVPNYLTGRQLNAKLRIEF